QVEAVFSYTTCAGAACFLVDLDPLGLKGKDRKDVAVPAVAGRRSGADVTRRPGVVLELKGPRREPRTGLIAGTSGQLGHVAGNVHHGPVPETTDRGRLRVAHGDHEAPGPCREAAPGQLRGDVLTAGTEDSADLRHRQLLALPQVGAGQRERGRRRKVAVRVRTHLTLLSVKRSIERSIGHGLGTLVWGNRTHLSPSLGLPP